MSEEFRLPPIETKEQRMKRMLGIRDFPKRTDEEKRALLGSDERLRTLDAITTTTLPLSKKEVKIGVVLEIVEKGLISDELLRTNPMVYIGSGTDVEYPLALGGRIIVMVDPILSDEAAFAEVVQKLTKLTGFEPKRDGNKLQLEFDYGQGKEVASITIETRPYEDEETSYSLPQETGVIVLYASQGPSGAVRINDDMKAKLIEGGVILDDTELYKINKKTGEKIVQLGR